MAKRYTATVPMIFDTEGANGNDRWWQYVDLALYHSQRVQRNVRQGHVFHIHKIQANLQSNGGDVDTGLAISGVAKWCPATKNSVKAWQHLFGVWRKQKGTRVGAIGPIVRYDDFEVAYDTNYASPRTSSIYTQGFGDTTSEHVVIYGNSIDDANVTLEDTFNSLQDQAPYSRFPISNLPVKSSKFAYEFPKERKEFFGGAMSTILPSDNALTEPDSGAVYMSVPAHVSDTPCLAGQMLLEAYFLPEDVAGFTGDNMTFWVNITYSLGSPLTPRRKASTPRRKTYRRKTTKRTTKRTKR